MRRAGDADRRSGRFGVLGGRIDHDGSQLARGRRDLDVQFERVRRRRGWGEGIGRIIQGGDDGFEMLGGEQGRGKLVI